MVLPILAYGSPILRIAGENLTKDYPGLKELIDNMYDTLYAADGVGLAAHQIGQALKLFIVDTSPFSDKYPEAKDFKRVFINTEIIEKNGDDLSFEEGCLSFPGVREDVSRPPFIKVRYFDENFKKHEEEFTGIVARVIQHEFDHTNGVFFIDKINPLRKMLLKNRLNNIIKGVVDVKYKMKFSQFKRK